MNWYGASFAISGIARAVILTKGKTGRMIESTGIAYWPIGVQGPQPARLRIEGKDNYGKPRQEFADYLAALDDNAFVREAEDYIWLSAYAANNYRSDYHWKADACHDESIRRGNPELYERAWHQASGM